MAAASPERTQLADHFKRTAPTGRAGSGSSLRRGEENEKYVIADIGRNVAPSAWFRDMLAAKLTPNGDTKGPQHFARTSRLRLYIFERLT